MNPTDRISEIPQLPTQGGQANVPGVRRLWLIETRHVLGVLDPRTTGGVMTSWTLTPEGLNLAEDAVIHAFKFPADRGDFDQKSTTTVHGVVYAQSLVLDVPRDHSITALAAQRMTGRKWVAVYEDANGLRKLVGTTKQPLRFLAQQKTSPNGYAFSWMTETRQPAYFFNDNGLLDLLVADGGTAEFSYGFSYDFYS